MKHPSTVLTRRKFQIGFVRRRTRLPLLSRFSSVFIEQIFFAVRNVLRHFVSVGSVHRPEIPSEVKLLPELLTPSMAAMVELFDHLPDVAFFIKDADGCYRAVNQSLVERVGLHKKAELLGRQVCEIFPGTFAERYASQDEWVMRTGRDIRDRLELHWYPRRRAGWCLTTKVPIRDSEGCVIGLVGTSRDLRAPGEAGKIPPGLSEALEFLESHYGEPLTPSDLAARAHLPPVRFARLIKRIFRLTPSHLITQTRLSAASRLLRESDRQVAEIALECGFYDHSAFTRAFRSAMGATPTEFRRGASSGSVNLKMPLGYS